MSAKPQQNLFMKAFGGVFIFLYLLLLLWSALLRPAIGIDTNWVPKSFFSSAKQSTCIIRMHHSAMLLFEAAFFATIALFGYYDGSLGGVGSTIYGITLANFEESMMGVGQKYRWICFVPWIITFVQKWLENVVELLVLFSADAVYETKNFFSSLAMMMGYFLVQALLASEIVCMALRGWCAMKHLNEENMLWEQRKRILAGDGGYAEFGVKTEISL